MCYWLSELYKISMYTSLKGDTVPLSQKYSLCSPLFYYFEPKLTPTDQCAGFLLLPPPQNLSCREDPRHPDRCVDVYFDPCWLNTVSHLHSLLFLLGHLPPNQLFQTPGDLSLVGRAKCFLSLYLSALPD